MFATRFRGQKNLLIKVPVPSEYKSQDFLDNKNCYIAKAVKAQLSRVKMVSVVPHYISINHIGYRILGGAGEATFIRGLSEAYQQRGDCSNRFFVVPLERID